MISETTLHRWRLWFGQYTGEYMDTDERSRETLALKFDHTMRVCAEILDLGQSLRLDDYGLRIAEAIALFHDLGRFEQYRSFNTFSDGKSVNHAHAGIDVLMRHGILEDVEDDERAILVHAISHHNALVVPPADSRRADAYSRMIRDADKLDIYRVLIDHYRESSKNRNSAIDLDLPLKGAVSEEVMDQVMSGRLASMACVRSVSDFKLLLISWVYDINYTHTFRRLRERDCLGALFTMLGGVDGMDEIRARVSFQMERGCDGELGHDPP
ncbi:MAG: HD domain-containing protein [Spirochaetes bacterium]|nr:HD domain-containing protein [Spirochaetota bacterium]